MNAPTVSLHFHRLARIIVHTSYLSSTPLLLLQEHCESQSVISITLGLFNIPSCFASLVRPSRASRLPSRADRSLRPRTHVGLIRHFCRLLLQSFINTSKGTHILLSPTGRVTACSPPNTMEHPNESRHLAPVNPGPSKIRGWASMLDIFFATTPSRLSGNLCACAPCSRRLQTQLRIHSRIGEARAFWVSLVSVTALESENRSYARDNFPQ